MNSLNLWNLTASLLDFFSSVGSMFQAVWNASFKVGDITFTFPQMATAFMIVLLGLMFIKKFIPVA